MATKEKINILKKHRKKIDKIDNQIIKLIKKRIKITKIIGNFKRKNGFKIYDKKREQEIFKEPEKNQQKIFSVRY